MSRIITGLPSRSREEGHVEEVINDLPRFALPRAGGGLKVMATILCQAMGLPSRRREDRSGYDAEAVAVRFALPRAGGGAHG
ncbi:hypothetical protein MOTC310_07695 [Methylobacterium oryzae]|uniref:Uncharacterized protein n=1 Tax=Methylobacterium oryzae TaxID=334852 RepID=A0ABU7TKY3_9HYPH